MHYPDGRYLVRSGGTVTAVPTDTAIVKDNLDRAVRATVEGFREQNDPGHHAYA